MPIETNCNKCIKYNELMDKLSAAYQAEKTAVRWFRKAVQRVNKLEKKLKEK